MSEETRRRADERFEEALARTGGRDPRAFYREQLRELRDRDPGAYGRAVAYFEKQLVPLVADEESDPLAAWMEYGCLLARELVPGSPVQIDPTGRARPYEPPVPGDHLVLHLPSSTREPALAIGLPVELSPAQRASYELLVKRRTGS